MADPVVYTSKRKYMCLWMKRPVETFHPVSGHTIMVDPGKRIDFIDGTYVTSDPEEIDFLDKHPEYGISFSRSNVAKPSEDLISNFTEGPAIPPINIKTAEADPDKVAEVLVGQEVFKKIVEKVNPLLKQANEGKRVFTCKICGEKFKSGFDLGKHRREKHPTGK